MANSPQDTGEDVILQMKLLPINLAIKMKVSRKCDATCKNEVKIWREQEKRRKVGVERLVRNGVHGVHRASQIEEG